MYIIITFRLKRPDFDNLLIKNNTVFHCYPSDFYNKFEIVNVIFNDPATIVFWKDGTKTIVKCQDGDEFDPEKGLAMAISKKCYDNVGKYNEVFKKWLKEGWRNE